MHALRRQILLTALTLTLPTVHDARAGQAPISSPTFEAVSIKPSPPDATGSLQIPMLEDLPNGGFRAKGAPIAYLLGRAFPDVAATDIVGLPGWVSNASYEISATVGDARPRSREEQSPMFRALLVERFQLAFHWEDRERDVFRMVKARPDGALGPQMKAADIDCSAGPVPTPSADWKQGVPPPPVCRLRDLYANIEGDATMPELARRLRNYAGRDVIDSTGLIGYYRLALRFSNRPAQIAPTATDQPSLFDAMREQLGLRLDAVRLTRPVLVIDRIERPSEN